MAGLNLHKVVSESIGAVNPMETVSVYQAIGQVNLNGLIYPKYNPPITLQAQTQSASDAALYHSDHVGQNSIIRNMYLISHADFPIAGIVRNFDRGGDIIERPDASFWLITAIIDDFSNVGWVCARTTLQVIPPDFSHSDWYHPMEPLS